MARIIKCENGHFYDADKDAKCPYCEKRKSGGPDRSGLPEEGSRILPDGGVISEDGPTVGLYPTGPDQVQIGGGGALPERQRMHGIGADQEGVTIGIYTGGTAYVTGWLVGRTGSARGRDYRIRAGRNHVGRDFSNDLLIQDVPGIAEKNHCELVYDERGNTFYVVPGKGTITWLNGKVLDGPARLETGDRIRMGDNEFDFIPYCREGRTWKEEEEPQTQPSSEAPRQEEDGSEPERELTGSLPESVELPEPETEPFTEPETESFTESYTEPYTEPYTEAQTNPQMEPYKEPAKEPETESYTEPA